MGILRGVRIYPIYRGKFGHYNWLGFSSSVHMVVRTLENLENLEMSGKNKMVRDNLENLEKSGNFLSLCQKIISCIILLV